jgi:hypothetical protein
MPMILRFALFFTVIFALSALVNVYAHRRISEVLALGRRPKWILGTVLGASVVALVAGRLIGRYHDGLLSELLETAGFLVQLGVVMAVVLALPVELGRAVAALARLIADRRQRARDTVRDSALAEPAAAEPAVAATVAEPAATPPPSSTGASAIASSLVAPDALPRRAFLTRGATGVAFVVGPTSSLYGTTFGRTDYRIEEVAIPIRGLPRALDGYTLVQLSDIHFGTFVGDPELRSAHELVGRARPDAVVLTGDLVDHDAAFAPLLGKLVEKLAPLTRDGVYAIAGNHDYYAGIDEVLGHIRRGGGTVLRNESTLIGDGGGHFALVGVDDLWAPRNGYGGGPDLDLALSSVPADRPRILLCHNPAYFPEAAPHVDLMLSGHTHGGQVQLGINPAELVLPFGYVAGEYTRGDATLYVNRGFGTAGPPARIGSPPEITRVVLVAA